MDYMTLKEASEKWGVSSRQVNYYCVDGRIPGAVKMAGVWLIPKEAAKPADRRYNYELGKLKDEDLTVFRRQRIGFIFQNYNLVPILNVYENIVMPIQLDGKKPDKKFIKEIVSLLGLEKKLYNMPNTLSGGQQQRVAIARALASKPAIILADEPTGNLDSKTSDEVIELLKVTSQKFHQTIVMITHNPEIAAQADRTIHIEDGRIAE